MASSSGMREVFREASNPTLADFFELNLSLCSFLTFIFVLFISNDRINDRAVKTLITKEAAAFERIRLLSFLYFLGSKLTEPRIEMYDLERLPGKRTVWEQDGHPCEICPDIKPDGMIGVLFGMACVHPFWQVSIFRRRIHNLALYTGISRDFPTFALTLLECQ